MAIHVHPSSTTPVLMESCVALVTRMRCACQKRHALVKNLAFPATKLSPKAVSRALQLCPDKLPDTFDDCNIDSRFLCAYSNTVVCDEAGWTFENEKECYCYDGHFMCTSNVCPVGCSVTPPTHGDSCSASFLDNARSYGEFCCPGDMYVPATSCYCDEADMTIKCQEPSIACPSLCPVSKPVDGNTVCNIDDRYVCEYDTGTCPIPFDFADASCTFSSGHFLCRDICSIMSIDFGDLGGPPGTHLDTGTPEEDERPHSTAVLEDTDGGHDQSNDKEKKGKSKQKKRTKSTEKKKRDGMTRKLLRNKLVGRDGTSTSPK